MPSPFTFATSLDSMPPVKRYPIIPARIRPIAPKRMCRFFVQPFLLFGNGCPQWTQNRAFFSFSPLHERHIAVLLFSILLPPLHLNSVTILFIQQLNDLFHGIPFSQPLTDESLLLNG